VRSTTRDSTTPGAGIIAPDSAVPEISSGGHEPDVARSRVPRPEIVAQESVSSESIAGVPTAEPGAAVCVGRPPSGRTAAAPSAVALSAPDLSAPGTAAWEAAAADLLARLDGDWRAAIVYGSRVRGDFTEYSDIDVLQLVDEPGPNYAKGLLTVTVRTARQLRVQCEDGDFYAYSLIREGRVLADPDGVLAETLAAFRPPTDNYARRWREYRMKLTLLDLPAQTFADNRVNFVRAALFLLRNACMIAHLRRYGQPCFSLTELARSLDIPRLPQLYQGRADPDNLTRERFDEVRATLGRLFALSDNG
jgi:hypothetical protein